MEAVKNKLTVQTTVNAPVEKVWQHFTEPEHVKKWNNASDDWYTPTASNDLQKGGTFNYRMEARDGSFGFDFTGVYDEVRPNEKIAYTMADGRQVSVTFQSSGGSTSVSETFDAETENSLEMQQQGWQAILDNLKNYSEKN